MTSATTTNPDEVISSSVNGCYTYAICDVNDAQSFAYGGHLLKGIIHNYNGMPASSNRSKLLKESYVLADIVLMT